MRLDWSGNAASYTVYRATECATVGASPVATQITNSYLDPSVPAEGFVCYLVQ